MNAQKMTQKTLEAIQLAHTTAVERGNQQIEQLHLLYALLAQQDSLNAQLLKKMGIEPAAFSRSVEQELGKIPSVSGPGREEGKIYISQETDQALAKAEKTADAMKDEYEIGRASCRERVFILV